MLLLCYFINEGLLRNRTSFFPFKNAKKITTKKNVVTVKKLKAGKKYFVKVRAFKKVGNKKIYGKYSTVKKVIVKK